MEVLVVNKASLGKRSPEKKTLMSSRSNLQRKGFQARQPFAEGTLEVNFPKPIISETNKAKHVTNNVSMPESVKDVLRTPGEQLNSGVRSLMKPHFSHDLSKVRVHTNRKAADSAKAVNALAYTVGQHVVFGQGQYSPNSAEGQKLLAHELTHTLQQKDVSMTSIDRLEVSSSNDHHEIQADQTAKSVQSSLRHQSMSSSMTALSSKAAPTLAASPIRVARLQRAISFTTADGAFSTNNVVKTENAAGFIIRSPAPTFQWTPNVTIHGAAGDPFSDWEVAHHQVGKGFHTNVWWGTGVNRTHRKTTISGGLPMRDATGAGNTWYHDPFAQSFAASGDIKSPVIRDTPSTGQIPWANPIAARTGTTGMFNYGFGFVSTLSARHKPTGTGAAAFRHLNHVHWNFGVTGNFDTTRAVGSRINLTGGRVNRGGVSSGFDRANRPMHGGSIINNNFNSVDI